MVTEGVDFENWLSIVFQFTPVIPELMMPPTKRIKIATHRNKEFRFIE
jgi:hypothetical protein